MNTRCLLALAAALVMAVAASGERRTRADPNGWFSDLVAADDAHDHSGEAAVRRDFLCCHRMAFDEDPSDPGEKLLTGIDVPYNYWWRRGSTLLSVAPTLDEPAARTLKLGDPGIELDFVAHSRLYVRLQCAYPCCIEAVEVLAPPGAQPLLIMGGNATHEIDPWRLDRSTMLPPGTVALGGGRWSQGANLHEMLWADQKYTDRLGALQLCDHATTGAWISIDSPSRIRAALTELDVCFVHHDVVADWDTGLCSEDDDYGSVRYF
jgi:hypothetical protein